MLAHVGGKRQNQNQLYLSQYVISNKNYVFITFDISINLLLKFQLWKYTTYTFFYF